MAAAADRALFLVDAHTAGREAIWRGLWAAVAAVLARMGEGDFYRGRSQEEAAAAIAALVDTAAAATGSLTAEFLDAMLLEQGVRPPAPGRVPPPPPGLRGIPTAEAWVRPFLAYRLADAAGADPRAAALLRAHQMADGDLSLGARWSARAHATASDQVVGVRRVIHPERSKSGEVCGLCLAASDQIYHKRDLMPVHTNCRCVPVEVTRRHDPGSALNEATLAGLYDTAGGTGADVLSRVRYRIDPHTELGPVLVAA